MVGRFVEAAVVLCAVIGFYAILAVLSLFPDTTPPLLFAVIGSFG